MKKTFLVLFLCSTALIPASESAAATTTSAFDAAYTVASSGSTTQVTSFDIDGPAPWLYLALPTAGTSGFDSRVKSDWFIDPSVSKEFSVDDIGTSASQFTFWLTPTVIDWADKKAMGDWHIDSSFEWKKSSNKILGSETINFTVTPEPASMALFGLGAGALGLARRRSKKRTI